MRWKVGGLALVFVLMAGCVGLAQPPLLEEKFDGVVPPAIPTGWTRNPDPTTNPENLWKTVKKDDFTGEPEEVRDFPSEPNAAYFGVVNSETGTGSYIGPGGRVYGELITQTVSVTPDHYIQISFWYLREVEYYTGGEFDVTKVEYSWNGTDWIELWKKSSKDPSEKVWKEFASDPIKVPSGVNTIWLRFVFDSVDGINNDHLGWLVDDVKITQVPKPLRITTTALDRGTVGETYSCVIEAEGGVGNYSWEIDPKYPLPQGLSLEEEDTDLDGYQEAVIRGTPEVAGSFAVKVWVTDGKGNRAYRVFDLDILPKGVERIEENFDSTSPPQLPPGWDTTGTLWHSTDVVMVGGADIVDANPANVAMYYGQDDATNPNYNTGRRECSCLISPAWGVTPYRGRTAKLKFDYWRWVEFCTGGAYDKTYVEYRFDQQEWRRVWYLDSTVYSEKEWESVEIDLGTIPADASTIQIRFCFDSVDAINNDYVGWLIDNLVLEFWVTELEIITQELPPAEEGAPYAFQLEARGGKPPYEWEIGEGHLPMGLTLDRHTGIISGIPAKDTVGTYDVKIEVRDSATPTPAVTSKTFQLLVNRRQSLFFDDFEGVLADKWEESPEQMALWHVTDYVSGVTGMSGKAAYYGKDDTTDPNYATGTRTKGALVSKPFGVDGTAFKLSFRYWREVEFYTGGAFDMTYVEVRFKIDDAWDNWRVIWHKDSTEESAKEWREAEAGPFLIPSGASEMQIRFVFDSIDPFYNNYTGWLIDNVRVSMASQGEPLPSASILPKSSSRGEVEFFNYPNPITDVHTTVFGVRGVEADLIRVEIYDLAGRLVWEGEALGNELAWHTEDLAGHYLANGVYLYVIYVKVGDSWIHSGIQKLAIYR